MPIIRSEIQKRLSQTLTIHSHYQVNFPKLAPFALSCPNVCSLFATEMRQKVLMCLKLPCTFYPFLQLMMSFYQFQFQFFFLTPALALILTRSLTKRSKRWLDIKDFGSGFCISSPFFLTNQRCKQWKGFSCVSMQLFFLLLFLASLIIFLFLSR